MSTTRGRASVDVRLLDLGQANGVVCCLIRRAKWSARSRARRSPKDNSGPVTIVTANTFDSIVFGGKDVLIE